MSTQSQKPARDRVLRNVSRRGFLAGLGLASAAGAAAASGCASQQQAGTQAAASKVAIIHTNDSHGHDILDEESLGLAAVAQLKHDYEEKGYEVLLFDAGDAAQGENLVNRSQGASAFDFLNQCGYQAMALGNHEFDYGQDKIAGYAAAAHFPLLSANVIVEATGERIVGANTIITLRDGRKVGVFGLTTPEAKTKVNPLLVRGIKVLQEKELYECAQAQVDELRAAGCALVVCLAHLGEATEAAPNRACDVVANVRGIDLVIDGHDHKEENQTLKDAAGADTLVVETGCFTHAVGVVTWEGGKLEGSLSRFGEYNGQDAAVAAGIKAVDDKVKADLAEVVGEVAFDLNGERSPGNRTQETNLGDLVADACLWEAERMANTAPVAAIVNGGSIRKSIHAGEIKLGDVVDTLPFINYMCTASVKGSAILEALEAATSVTPEQMGAFPQVAGMKITIDTSVAFQDAGLYPDTPVKRPAAPGSRVTIDEIGGRPFDPDASYVIAAGDFIFAGGDAYFALGEASQDTLASIGYLTSDCLRYYIAEAMSGAVREDYREPQGRIVIR
ncbi:MAG: bifunctional metallophosphatase/5'-nucleotidase [Olsenella sp.]|nr:bifunctional metallophosphatase/5'-nucleotidase [Olsenella sp.]